MDQMLSFLRDNNYLIDVIGLKNGEIDGFSSAKNYRNNSLTWIKNQENADLYNGEISVCIIPQNVNFDAKTIIVCNNPKAAFFSAVEHFWGTKENEGGVGQGTIIGNNVTIGKNVSIGNNCSITGNVSIGAQTIIGDNVVIRNNVKIGERCVVQSLTVIGEDGFAYSEDANHFKTMIKHYGGVIIGDDVFIGSHVNIARGTIDNTVIESGVKIAPSSHIGHNNYIEHNSTVICSQLYGSGHMGKNSYIVASVLRNQCSIGNNSMIGMGSVVTKDIEEHKLAFGTPAKVIKDI